MNRCRCRIPSLLTLRAALEMSQVQFAALLEITPRWVRQVEKSPTHRCLGYHALAHLRLALIDPYFRALLTEANYPHPFPEDLQNVWFPGARVGPRCHIDGIPLRTHGRCRGCTFLAGPGHSIPALSNVGLCPECERAILSGQKVTVR